MAYDGGNAMDQAIDRIEYWTAQCESLPLNELEYKVVEAERKIMSGEKVPDGYYFALIELIKRKANLEDGGD